MSDLISREAAIDALWKEPLCLDPLNVMAEARDRIEALPTIKAEPIKQGRWEFVYDNNGVHQVCPYCGEWRYHSKQLYCGNCGARINEVEE